jgi:hypothetical protein
MTPAYDDEVVAARSACRRACPTAWRSILAASSRGDVGEVIEALGRLRCSVFDES